jgi:hypothetical protein
MRKTRQRDNIHETPDVSYIQNPDVQHEESDVNVRAILLFVGGLLVFALLVHVLMWLLLNFFQTQEAKREPKPGPMALSKEERRPPEPRLQSAPGFQAEGQNLELQAPQAEYRVVREKWDETLEKGTVDEKTGARTAIPIKDAMKELLEQNALKSRPLDGNQQAVDQVGEMPSYSSSGRMMEKRMQ